MFVFEAFGERSIHLAQGGERNSFSESRTTVDAAGRHRLEKTGENISTADRGLINYGDSSLFMRVLWMISTRFHGILRS